MKKSTLSLFLFTLLFACIAQAQTLVSSQFLGYKTKAQLIAQLGNPLIKNGVAYYKITYQTPDVQGVTSIASALMVVPDDTTQIYPLLCYQHGTSSSKTDVPSSLNGEDLIPQIFAGLGFLAVSPDYLGLGDSPGFHPYVHAETEASAGADALHALVEFAESMNFCYENRVFLTGYSQGGHASAALHRRLDQTDEFNVVAAAHLSGPYSISGVMRDLLFADEPYSRPAYLINTMFSYQYVYGDLYADIAEAVKPAYLSKCNDFYNGTISLSELNDFLVTELTANEGAPIASRVFLDDFKAEVEADPNHPVNVALAANDVMDWAPTAPTRLYYCTADDQVPFENSLVAETALLAAGAANLDAVDVGATLNHTGCVTPAVTNALLLFLGLQNLQVCSLVSTVHEASLPFEVYPNPASDGFWVKNFPSNGELLVRDIHGRLLHRQAAYLGDFEVQTTNLLNGMYFLEISSEAGNFQTKLVVQR